MKFKSEKQTYSLSSADIDRCSEYLRHTLEKIGVERQNRIRICFTMEEVLLHFRRHFRENTEFQLNLFNRFGNPYVQIELEGEVFNPLSKMENELDEWSNSLLASLGISPHFAYSGGRNLLRIAIPTQGMNPILRILIALGCGILAGVLLNLLLTQNTAELVYDTLFHPVYDLWTRFLNLVSGPIIFFMVAATVLGLSRLTGKGANSTKLVVRYLLITLLIVIFVVGIVTSLSHIAITIQRPDHIVVSEVLDLLFRIVPSEIFTPFMEANTPQLILLGFAFGTVLSILRDQVPSLVKITTEANKVFLLLAEWISWLVPIFTGFILTISIISGQFRIYLILWRPLLISIIMTAIVVAIILIYTSVRKKVQIKVLLQKMSSPFLLTLKKGSLTASYGQTEMSCTRYMGIDREFTEVSLSHGLVLYMPASVLGAVVFTLRAVSLYEIQINFLQYIIVLLFVIILMEAAPPVPGVSLLVYTAVFNMLNIPDEVLIPGMVFDIVFGILATAVNQMLLQVEMIFQADRMGLLDRETLRKPLSAR